MHVKRRKGVGGRLRRKGESERRSSRVGNLLGNNGNAFSLPFFLFLFLSTYIGHRHCLLSFALFLSPRRNSLRDVRGRTPPPPSPLPPSYISFIPDNPLKSKLTVGRQPLPRSFLIPLLFFFLSELPLVFPVAFYAPRVAWFHSS